MMGTIYTIIAVMIGSTQNQLFNNSILKKMFLYQPESGDDGESETKPKDETEKQIKVEDMSSFESLHS